MTPIGRFGMPSSIRGKLVGGFAALLGLVAVFLLLVVPTVLRQQALREAEAEARALARLTSHGVEPALVFQDRLELEKVLEGVRQSGALRYIVVEDSSGTILATTDARAAAAAQYRLGLTQPGVAGDVFRSAVTIDRAGRRIGTLYLGLSMETLDAELARTRRQLGVVILAVVVGGIIATLLLGEHLTRPLTRMAAAARAIQAGDLSRRSGVDASDEAGSLARTFDAMVDSLQEAQDALRGLNRDLERRVAERTSALEAAVREIAHAERIARENEHRFRTMFEAAALGIVVISPDGEVREANPAFTEMWQSPPRDLIGRQFLSLVESPEEPDLEQGIRAVLDGSGNLAVGTIRPTAHVATPVWGQAVVSPVRDASGQVQFAFAMIENITTQRELAEQLRQSQRLESVGRLAGGVAHDFNNLLTTINGVAELLLAEPTLPDNIRADLLEIRGAGARAATLTRQMLAFSRRQTLQLQVLDLNALLRDVSSMIRRMIGEDVEMRLLLSDPLPHVRADVGQLTQVFMNLAVNARDAMRLGGTLGIETSAMQLTGEMAGTLEVRAGQAVRVLVWDTGDGMDPETMARIFEPFFTTKEVGKGSGLGLATVYGVIKQLGGAIKVESAIGAGARFTIILPAEDTPLERATRAEVAHESGGSETILLIEDSDDVRALTARVLRSRGYVVIECRSGDEALQVARSRMAHFDLIVSDVVLPGTSGPVTVEKIRATNPGTPVLFMSGYPRDELVRHGMASGDIHFLQKPMSPAELIDAARKALDSRSTQAR